MAYQNVTLEINNTEYKLNISLEFRHDITVCTSEE